MTNKPECTSRSSRSAFCMQATSVAIMVGALSPFTNLWLNRPQSPDDKTQGQDWHAFLNFLVNFAFQVYETTPCSWNRPSVRHTDCCIIQLIQTATSHFVSIITPSRQLIGGYPVISYAGYPDLLPLRGFHLYLLYIEAFEFLSAYLMNPTIYSSSPTFIAMRATLGCSADRPESIPNM